MIIFSKNEHTFHTRAFNRYIYELPCHFKYFFSFCIYIFVKKVMQYLTVFMGMI